MEARTKAGLWLVYTAWAPLVVWQLSSSWGPKILGELRYKALAATQAVDVIGVVWGVGTFLAGMYLIVGPDVFSFLRRGDRGR